MAKKDRPKSEKVHTIKMTLRVLGYPEGNKWVAHCLEMDILGYGRTFKEALRDLQELINMQVSFCVFKDEYAPLYHEAPAHIFEIYNKLARAYWESYPKPQLEKNYRIESLDPPTPPGNPVFCHNA